ncbi:MAG: DUF2058 domain-containing protein [Gammaproteobacteria bacterium]|nr:DUF2058 domain-containing protein [Gammaproteobacteria bacterium]
MTNSLQDQLLSSGLIDKKQLNKARTQQQKDKRKKATGLDQKDTNKQSLTNKKIDAGKARDLELNRAQRQHREQKALRAQIGELISANRISRGEGELTYQFVDQGWVRKLFIDEVTRQKLISGAWAIVRADGRRYEIVPASTAEKIRIRDEKCVILCVDPDKTDKNTEESDYPDHQIPDDMMW